MECAVEFQKAIKERNSSEEALVKLQFRIGINSGDVIKIASVAVSVLNDRKLEDLATRYFYSLTKNFPEERESSRTSTVCTVLQRGPRVGSNYI